jgi:DNA-binding SARP family transcriptional activator/tetratricopeptide (TPR) repeat protein
VVGVRFRILGPLSVLADDTETAIAGRRDRVVLAMLLLHANNVVTVDRLVDAVWPHSPPPTARAQIHSCISRLRKALALADGEGPVIHSRPGGYLLPVKDDQLDLALFINTVACARAAMTAERLTDADSLYRSALALWRGPALLGINSRAVCMAAFQWEEQRIAVLEEHFDLRLHLGQEREFVDELTNLVDRYPLREHLRWQLMLALYRTGRQAAALTAYRQGRRHLSAELGIEPGDELVQLHHQILNRDPHLSPAKPGHIITRVEATPHTLPRDIADFTGREEVVAELCRAIPERMGLGGSAPVVLSIDGMAGVGKTTLALRVAHLVAQRFADAQLYLDLHGHSDRSPLEPASALDTLLRQLGVPGDRIPRALDERVALWRTELAHRHALVVLDNASNTRQVTPLLPSAAGCATLITSRRRLLGLDGALTVSLQALTDAEAIALLERVVGARVSTARQDAAELAKLCGNLALALRLAAARLVHRPRWQIKDLTAVLRQTTVLKPEFAAEGRTVASAFALSYRHLNPPVQRLFRLLGLHPGPEIDTAAAASLAGIDAEDSGQWLEELVDSHLVQEPELGRYRLHDLIRNYAKELAELEETDADRDAALQRLMSFMLRHAAAASAYFPFPQVQQEPDAPHGPTITFPDAVTAVSWLDAAYPILLRLIRHAAAVGWYDATYQLTRAIWWHQYQHAYHDDCLEIHGLALAAAQRLGDEGAIAHVINNRASVNFVLGRWQDALADLMHAAHLAHIAEDREAEARSLNNSAKVLRRLGRYEKARFTALRAAAIFKSLGSIHGYCGALIEAEDSGLIMGRNTGAVETGRMLLRIARKTNESIYAQSLAHLGRVELMRGRYMVAVRLLRRAVRLLTEVGRIAAAEAALDLGRAYSELNDFDTAFQQFSEVLDTMQLFHDTAWESEVRTVLAAAFEASGDRGTAVDQYRQALALAELTDARLEQARALDGLAKTLASSQPRIAQECRQHALALYEYLELPETDSGQV